MKCLKYILMVMSAVAWGHDNRCCEEGRVLLKRKPACCWEPATNSTVNITLTCTAGRARSQWPYVLNSDGSLTFYHYMKLLQENRSITFEPRSFCVGEQTTLTDLKLERTEKVFVFCLDDDSDSPLSKDFKMYCILVSCIFLALTASVYSCIPELRDLLGKSIINYCLSAALALLILFIMNMVPYSDMELCAVRGKGVLGGNFSELHGFLEYFFLIASYFWTNAISIQVLISMRRPYLDDGGWREFIWYALYAWGCSAALTVCVVVANYLPGDHKRPGIGMMTCWFFDDRDWYYFFSIMGILIIANIIIYSWCMYYLWSNRFDSSQARAARYKCMMSLRLFILMGIPWIFELISSAAESGIVTAVLDIFTALQGLLTFVVLVLLRQRALKMLLRRGWLCCLSRAAEQRLALVADVEDIAEHSVDYKLDEHSKHNGVCGTG